MCYFNGKILELLDELKIDSFSLIGNSLGGALSIGLALNEPDRIQKLILMAPGGVEDRKVYDEMPGIKKLLSDFLGGSMDQEKIEGLLELFPLSIFFIINMYNFRIGFTINMESNERILVISCLRINESMNQK